MITLPTTIHWAILFPILTLFIGTAVVLTGFVRSVGGERWSILVPVSGVSCASPGPHMAWLMLVLSAHSTDE